jgi:hypothetical protein
MEDAGGATRALAGLLGSDGPRNLVLAVMNNAELRGAGGYASSFTRITTDDGRLTVEAFQDVNDVFDPPGSTVQVPAPPEFRERYGRYLADTTLWKNSLMSAHVPYSAAVVCQVARVNPGLPCDGVVLIDVPTLAALTTVQGPVQLADGEEVAGEALVDALLVVAYAEVDQTPGGDPGRRAALRAAADRGLVQLLGSEVGGPEVVQVLLAAVRGRHMALWSDDVQEQAALEAAGLAGSADPEGGDVNLVAMNQFSISKLDHYVDRRIEVDVVVGLQTALVTQRVTLALDAPEDLPQVVRGKGRLTGDLDIATALDAELLSVELDGAPTRFRRAVEAGSTRVSVAPDVPDGGSSTWTVQYTVPLTDGRYRLELLPQPLSRDADLRLSVAPAEGLVLTGVRGDLEVAGPFDVARTVEVQATVEQPSWWDRPVTLG